MNFNTNKEKGNTGLGIERNREIIEDLRKM